MVEIIIERWIGADQTVDYRWSVWRDGLRLQMGPEVYATAEACASEAREFCVHGLGCEPDRVTRL